MGIFGWSYPPGCSGPPDQDEGPCEVCGYVVDECVCPECPVCGAQGDPKCYGKLNHEDHGMTLTPQQIVGRVALDLAIAAQAEADRAEAEYWADPQRQVEEAQFAELMREEAKR